MNNADYRMLPENAKEFGWMTMWDFQQVAFWKANYLKLLLLREFRKTFESVAIEGERIAECMSLAMLESPKLLFLSTCQMVLLFHFFP